VIIVRFADDIVAGFQHRADAEQFHADLVERFARFNLELNAEKTRLIEFGRFAAQNRRRRGLGRPETFAFLGFTHMCTQQRGAACKGGPYRDHFFAKRPWWPCWLAACLPSVAPGLIASE